MDILARLLDSMRLGDGKPDTQTRKAELHNLVTVLSTFEIRRLQDQLSLHMHNLTLDICANLPVELLLHVADYLSLEDVMKAHYISRPWNRAFSSPEFCVGIIKKHFPLVWQNQYVALDPNEQILAKSKLQKWLPNAAVSRMKRQHGLYHSIALYRYHFEQDDSRPLNAERKYCNGRVAFLKSPYSFIVKSLRSRDVRILTTENRTTFFGWWLSGQYIFAQSPKPYELHAWDLNSSAEGTQSLTIRLPSQILELSACQNQVAIVDQSKEVLLWTIAGPTGPTESTGSVKVVVCAPKIHDPHLGPKRHSERRVLFRPNDPAHLFDLVIEDDLQPNAELDTTFQVKLIVSHYIINNSDCVLKSVHTIKSATARKTNSYRNWDVGFIDEVTIGLWSRAQFPREPFFYPRCFYKLPRTLKKNLVLMMTFNTYTNESPLLAYDLPFFSVDVLEHAGNTFLSRLLLWRSEAHFPQLRHSKCYSGLGDVPPDFKICNPAPLFQNPYYPPTLPISPHSTSKITGFLEDDDIDPDVLYEEKLEIEEIEEIDLVIRGDDDFVVQFGPDCFVVWCFDKMVELSKEWSSVKCAPGTGCPLASCKDSTE